MKCILMNKNKEVLVAEYNEISKFFDYIYEVNDINYAPYILKSFYIEKNIDDKIFRTNLSEWFKGRGIPSWRDKLDILLHRLNITAPYELLDKAPQRRANWKRLDETRQAPQVRNSNLVEELK